MAISTYLSHAGEVVRFLLEYTGQKYSEQGPTTRAEFLQLRDTECLLPFGQIPVLQVPVSPAEDNQSAVINIAQTQAIVEYLAMRYDYLGLNGGATAISRATVYV